MSIVRNNKVLVLSISQLEDHRIILGDAVNMTAISVYNTYITAKKYAEAQIENGALGYEEKVKRLDRLMLDLAYTCPTICNYKN